MGIKETIKTNPKLKSLTHRVLIPKNEARPRWWVRNFLNPFIHKKGKSTIIRGRVRVDLVPFNEFSIGDFSIIEDFSVINNCMGALHIGKNSVIGLSNVLIGPLKIGNNVIIAQHVVLSGLNHGYENPDVPIKDQACTTAEIIVNDDCWIGANSVIVAGITIGKHAVVAGGSVVTKDVAPFTIVAGNPAKAIKFYNHETKSWEKINRN